MIINHNIAALNTHRQLGANTAATSKNIEKLSSGLRINRAGDDAAGLAISEKMRGQIRGLDMAAKNSQDGISMIQTAEGALNETHSILQRMRELAVQSSNGTNTDADRTELQKEITQLKSEVDRISTDTEFNTKKLLNGDVAVTAKSASNFANTKLTGATVVNDNMKADAYTVTAATVSDVFTETANSTDVTAIALDTGKTAELGKYTLSAVTNAGDATKLDYTLKDANGKEIGTATVAKSATSAKIGAFDFTKPDSTGGNTGEGTLEFTVGQTATFTVADSNGTTVESKTVTNNTTGKASVGGLELTFNTDLTAANDADVKVNNNSVQLQIGANENQVTKLGIGDMGSKALSIDTVDVSTNTGAASAITTINNAIEKVSGERSKLGAVQNRLEHTINNLSTSSENLTAAESRVRDVDMAKEMMQQTKNNILAQAAQAMLAQANQQPQGVLQLLR